MSACRASLLTITFSFALLASGCELLDTSCPAGFWRPRAMEDCVPLPDGGIDAGRDAGGPEDAGPSDAGAMDAELADGALLDAAIEDDGAMPDDAGQDDGSVADGGEDDGGAPDGSTGG